MEEKNINAIKFIHSVHEFVNEIKLLDKALDNSQNPGRLFFRGQRNAEWSVHPSIFRNGWLAEESNMYSRLLLSSPSDFSNQNSAYEKLTKMQHYGLPSRITSYNVCYTKLLRIVDYRLCVLRKNCFFILRNQSSYFFIFFYFIALLTGKIQCYQRIVGYIKQSTRKTT